MKNARKRARKQKDCIFFSEQILQAGFSFQPFVRDLRIYCLSGKYSPTWIV